MSGATALISRAWRAAPAVPCVLGHAVRVPLLALLLLLEPLVRFVLTMFAVLALFVAVFFEFAAPHPAFPLWGLLAFAFACALARFGYAALLAHLMSWGAGR